MNISLHEAHIQNYRSINDLFVKLSDFSVLFGMNDSGKSNIVHALKIGLGNVSIDLTDIYSSPQNPFNTTKSVIVDLLFVPMDESKKRAQRFNDSWGLHLGVNVMSDENDNEFFAFRTEYSYDPDREEYIRERKNITEWSHVRIVPGSSIGYKTLAAFDMVLIDAQRDIAADIRDKNSIWSKQISKIKLSPDAKLEIENSLSLLSARILSESPFLQQVASDLSTTMNSRNSNIQISPITRNVEEIYKGLDIYVSQEASEAFPIANLGLGTRSRAVFSAMKSIINARIATSPENPYYCMIAFEEPEAHVHPNSQKQLVRDFMSIKGQKIITTHSPYLLMSSALSDLIHVSLREAQSWCTPISTLPLQKEELRQVERYVVSSRGEVLFSEIIILAEGETEEQALNIFFKTYFGKDSFNLGVSIIGVGGKNYLPFLRILKAIKAKWFIFSDGESAAITDLKRVMKKLESLDDLPDLSIYPNIFILDNSNDFETYLLENNYDTEIIAAINQIECSEEEREGLPFFDAFIEKHHGESLSPRSTGTVCVSCGQPIKDKPLRDYLSEGGHRRALCDCMKAGKAKYAASIAQTICNECPAERKCPPKIKELFDAVKPFLEV